MKSISFLLDGVYVKDTEKKGRGMFTKKDIEEDTTVEIAPVIVMSGADRKLIDQTLLHDYIFEWGEKKTQCCMALGYISIYNHSYTANCGYEMNFRKKIITIKTVRKVKAGEELLINYNGEWNNEKPVWFEVSEK